MTNHPITPPEQLLELWEWTGKLGNWQNALTLAYRAGADQELEACLLLVGDGRRENLSQVIALRNARRPKPPSVKEQALARTDAILNDPNRALLVEVRETLELNRRALEELS